MPLIVKDIEELKIGVFTNAKLTTIPRPPLNIQMPPSLPSWILFLLSVGLLSVLIQTPAIALSNISLSSIQPRPINAKIQVMLFIKYILKDYQHCETGERLYIPEL